MKYKDAFEAGVFYHVFNHAVGSDNLFRNDENFRYFLRKYAEYTADVLETYAYCLMPNHFHFLVRVKNIEQLATHPKFKQNTHELVMQQFSNFLNSYAKAYNIRYERKGALFLDFTKRVAVQNDAYFSALVNYIHQNPVHHGFCQKIQDWEYSSYASFLSDKPTKLMREEVLNWFGNTTHFLQFHQQHTATLQESLEFL